MSNQIIPKPPTGVQCLPDTDRYANRFDVRSQSSNRMYRISYDKSDGMRCWVCSCPGYLRHGHCKHTTSIGLSPVRSTRPVFKTKTDRSNLNG